MSQSRTDLNNIKQDFQRDVFCLFGFPVDNLCIESAAELLKKSIVSGRHIVLATLNVNWIVTSLQKPDFRAAILNSDICTLDGKPLALLSRLLGLPVRGMVPGSSLAEHLLFNEDPENPFSIFLFGGESDAGKKAYEEINLRHGGLKAVGYINPGFGTITQMSDSSIIERINCVSPDILLVALGAQKGTFWIEQNRKKLNAHIISHMGATINFLAGSVARAPVVLRRMALEWAWRILEEPYLFRRYLRDGIFLFSMLMKRFLLFFKYCKYRKRYRQHSNENHIDIKETPDWITLKFGRVFIVTERDDVRKTFYQAAIKYKNLILDFDRTEFVDNAFLAYLVLLAKHQKKTGKHLRIINLKKKPLREIFYFNFIWDTLESLNIMNWQKEGF